MKNQQHPWHIYIFSAHKYASRQIDTLATGQCILTLTKLPLWVIMKNNVRLEYRIHNLLTIYGTTENFSHLAY